MATEAPDPRTFKSWEDAFQYPIPVVRKLEAQLRSNAGENREKLRSLVGSSYRDLLDTAETIIDMEVRMEQVEAKLAKVGHNCNSRGLERISSNAVKMDRCNMSRDQERYTLASQLAVLRSCPVVMARLMRQEGSYLLIAKVLVISRLIHKGLGQSKSKPAIVDQIWDKLIALRRKLLRRIDKHLATGSVDSSTLVESMCAYSLATSSTPTDVLRHFQHVRKEEIVKTLQHADGLAKHGTDALKLCIQTCQDTQTIFPRRLADALAKLKTQPLVQDSDVRALYELHLDVHDRWIGEEARNYTPWPRHDELQRPEAEKMSHQWSKQAISAFLQGIKTALDKAQQLKEVASLRQELIETWIMSGSRMAGVKSASVLDNLRDTMNSRLEAIVRSRAQDLKGVVTAVSHAMEGGSIEGSRPSISLWTTGTTSNDLGNGAQSFKSTIINTHHGRDEAVIGVVATFDKWMDSVLEVKAIVKSMKDTRWDDTFTDEVDDSDDDFAEPKQTLLSEDDPRHLEEATQEALADALKSLGKSFEQIVTAAAGTDGSSFTHAIFILRVVRELGDRVPKLRLQDRSTAVASPFTSAIMKPLHSTLTKEIARPSTDAYQKSLASAIKARSMSHILWEGNPPIPAQPSPSAFKFLQTLTKNMASHGSDLWAPDAVAVLKAEGLDEVLSVWQEAFDSIKQAAGAPKPKSLSTDGAEAEVNGEAEDDAPAETKPKGAVPSPTDEELKIEKLKQLLFDILYIQRYLTSSNSDSERGPEDILQAVYAASCADASMLSRLKEKASDYSRKTYLLFALLA
ncbi:hypothetical protein BDV96DRAFT_643157 [Lophiotrema nucula]|uniref:Conserved oligomeric Golgi complex subunit 1 n=1 Tax=Lophiotrema nucula TaxID=690887 RepID=A0A6A5ZIM6_9PLEO|nr:hypothetical protein BDV96DRAFT_643157 [Lophiotrema nucula]